MVELIWPSQCAGCGRRHDGRLCRGCRPRGVHRVAVPVPGLSGAWTLAGYDAGIGVALRTAKINGDRQLAWQVAQAFGVELALALSGGRFTAIVPAPCHWTRRIRRGFSLPAILATSVSRYTGIPVCHALCTTGGRRQATLNVQQRRENLRGRIRSRRAAPGTVVLIDDVVTTGATVDACTRELLGDETQSVWLATVCARRRHPQAVSASVAVVSNPLTSFHDANGPRGRT